MTIENESRFLGLPARIVRLHSGIVGIGIIVGATATSVSVELERALPAGTTGEVYVEVYSGEDVLHRVSEVVSCEGKRVTLAVEPRPADCPGDRRLWWVQNPPVTVVEHDWGSMDIVVKAVGPEHIGFDSPRPLLEFGAFKTTITLDGHTESFGSKLLWQTIFAGAVHGVIQLDIHGRVDTARWRLLASAIAGVEARLL